MTFSRRHLLAVTALASLARFNRAHAATIPAWGDVIREGSGGQVFFNAWGGDDRTNAFIAWAGERMVEQHKITVHHVRLNDTADAVARVVAEKSAGRARDGSVDMIWINGPNFLQMKQAALLYGPVVDSLPHAGLIDRVGHPSNMIDFTVPVDGFAVPWRIAQIVYVYDSARETAPPRSIPAMLIKSQLVCLSLSARACLSCPIRTRTQPPLSFLPSRVNLRSPLASIFCASPSGSQKPRSHSMTVPPPY